MKPGLAALRINCTVTASQIKRKEKKKNVNKIVTYRLIMFCIFLGREFEEKISRFLLQKLMVIYWELCGSIYIVFY